MEYQGYRQDLYIVDKTCKRGKNPMNINTCRVNNVKGIVNRLAAVRFQTF